MRRAVLGVRATKGGAPVVRGAPPSQRSVTLRVMGEPGATGRAIDGKLTVTERRVLELADEGFTVDETAAHLFVHAETVKSHRKNAQRRLGARNIAHAVAVALRTGEIQ